MPHASETLLNLLTQTSIYSPHAYAVTRYGVLRHYTKKNQVFLCVGAHLPHGKRYFEAETAHPFEMRWLDNIFRHFGHRTMCTLSLSLSLYIVQTDILHSNGTWCFCRPGGSIAPRPRHSSHSHQHTHIAYANSISLYQCKTVMMIHNIFSFISQQSLWNPIEARHRAYLITTTTTT